MGNNLRDDKQKRELLKRNLKKIIDGIDNGVSTEKIIEKVEKANNYTRPNLEEFCYPNALEYLKEEIKYLESEKNYKNFDIYEKLNDQTFANYFGYEDTLDTKQKYREAIKGIEGNDYGLYLNVKDNVDDFSLDKYTNPELYFQTFLSEGVIEVILNKTKENNEFDRDIYMSEMTIPDLKIVANKISKELGKDPKYSKEEIEKDILKVDEINKAKEKKEY